jgi:hypothetical protein
VVVRVSRHGPPSDRYRFAGRASVRVRAEETTGSDEEGASCRACIALLLPRKSERVRHARYVRELASETTKEWHADLIEPALPQRLFARDYGRHWVMTVCLDEPCDAGDDQHRAPEDAHHARTVLQRRTAALWRSAQRCSAADRGGDLLKIGPTTRAKAVLARVEPRIAPDPIPALAQKPSKHGDGCGAMRLRYVLRRERSQV